MAEITFNIINGTAPYHVELIPDIGTSWTFGSSGTKTIYGIPAGSYQLKITDANGCIVISNGDIIITTTTTTEEPVTTTTCDPSKCDYGLLYNWYAVDTGKLAPTGWRVPTDAEWTTLTTWLTNNGYGYGGSGNDIAKSIAYTCGWNLSESVGTPGNDQINNNSSGFSGLPAGWRANIFQNIGIISLWWSSTTNEADTAWGYYIASISDLVWRDPCEIYYGLNVRCVRDYYEGWENDVPVVDYDGNEYDVINLGTQLWLVQNLKVTHYNDGEVIPNITDNTEWDALTTGALCAYNNDWETYACVPEPTTTTTTEEETTTTTTPTP